MPLQPRGEGRLYCRRVRCVGIALRMEFSARLYERLTQTRYVKCLVKRRVRSDILFPWKTDAIVLLSPISSYASQFDHLFYQTETAPMFGIA